MKIPYAVALQHLWARGYFCATAGSVTKETIQKYIESQFEQGDQKHFRIDGETDNEFQS